MRRSLGAVTIRTHGVSKNATRSQVIWITAGGPMRGESWVHETETAARPEGHLHAARRPRRRRGARRARPPGVSVLGRAFSAQTQAARDSGDTCRPRRVFFPDLMKQECSVFAPPRTFPEGASMRRVMSLCAAAAISLSACSEELPTAPHAAPFLAALTSSSASTTGPTGRSIVAFSGPVPAGFANLVAALGARWSGSLPVPGSRS